jgi:hypothetical protein
LSQLAVGEAETRFRAPRAAAEHHPVNRYVGRGDALELRGTMHAL